MTPIVTDQSKENLLLNTSFFSLVGAGAFAVHRRSTTVTKKSSAAELLVHLQELTPVMKMTTVKPKAKDLWCGHLQGVEGVAQSLVSEWRQRGAGLVRMVNYGTWSSVGDGLGGRIGRGLLRLWLGFFREDERGKENVDHWGRYQFR